MTLLKPEIFVNAITKSEFQLDSNFTKEIKGNMATDELFTNIIKDIQNGNQDNEHYSISDGLLFYKGSICIPNNRELKRLFYKNIRFESNILRIPERLIRFEYLNRPTDI